MPLRAGPVTYLYCRAQFNSDGNILRQRPATNLGLQYKYLREKAFENNDKTRSEDLEWVYPNVGECLPSSKGNILKVLICNLCDWVTMYKYVYSYF